MRHLALDDELGSTTAGGLRMLTEAEISGAGEGRTLIVTDGDDRCCASYVLDSPCCVGGVQLNNIDMIHGNSPLIR